MFHLASVRQQMFRRSGMSRQGSPRLGGDVSPGRSHRQRHRILRHESLECRQLLSTVSLSPVYQGYATSTGGTLGNDPTPTVGFVDNTMPVYDFDCRAFAWFTVPSTVASGVVYDAYLQFNSPSSPPAAVGTISVYDLNNHTKADFLNVPDPSTRYDTLGSWANGNWQGDAYPLQTTSQSISLIHYTDPSGIWERAFANGEEAGFVFMNVPLRGDYSPADDSTNIDLSNITLRLDYAPPPTKIGPADGTTFLVGKNSRVDWSCNKSSTNVNYRVWYSKSPNFSTIDYAFITDNAYHETDLLPAGRWYWRVQSRLNAAAAAAEVFSSVLRDVGIVSSP